MYVCEACVYIRMLLLHTPLKTLQRRWFSWFPTQSP